VLDTINFGSGRFPTFNRGSTMAMTERLTGHARHRGGPWTAAELRAIEAAHIAAVLGRGRRPSAHGPPRRGAARAGRVRIEHGSTRRLVDLAPGDLARFVGVSDSGHRRLGAVAARKRRLCLIGVGAARGGRDAGTGDRSDAIDGSGPIRPRVAAPTLVHLDVAIAERTRPVADLGSVCARSVRPATGCVLGGRCKRAVMALPRRLA
jgi:hypothetical protein